MLTVSIGLSISMAQVLRVIRGGGIGGAALKMKGLAELLTGRGDPRSKVCKSTRACHDQIVWLGIMLGVRPGNSGTVVGLRQGHLRLAVI